MGVTTCTIGSSIYKDLKLKKKEEKRIALQAGTNIQNIT